MMFWHIRGLAKATSDDGFADSKALIVVAGAQGCLIVAVLSLISVVLQQRILPAPGLATILFSFGVAFALIAVNHRMLLFQNRWRRFETEFKRYPRGVRIVQAWFVWIAVILIIALMLVATSAASRIPR